MQQNCFLKHSKNYSIIIAIIIILLNSMCHQVISLSANLICNRIPGLTPNQQRICEQKPDSLAVISSGFKMGINECQKQSRNRRWNCTSVINGNQFGFVVVIGSREASFTYAVSSAGVTYAVSQACSRGNISFCGCSDRVDANHQTDSNAWKWSGCSTNIRYGMRLAKQFVDSREMERDSRSLMNLHNNNAGRKAVKDMLSTACKCHGVSGSCSIRTCWKVLPSFTTIGDHLITKYFSAKRVIPHWGSKRNVHRKPYFLKLRRISSNNRQTANILPKPRDLVYLDKSPNYCDRNALMDSLGTSGRQCNASSHATDSCHLLCCGRGYHTHQYLLTNKCHCKFQFCCFVNCKQCTQRTQIHICK